jgi:hypothetical protein
VFAGRHADRDEASGTIRDVHALSIDRRRVAWPVEACKKDPSCPARGTIANGLALRLRGVSDDLNTFGGPGHPPLRRQRTVAQPHRANVVLECHMPSWRRCAVNDFRKQRALQNEGRHS